MIDCAFRCVLLLFLRLRQSFFLAEDLHEFLTGDGLTLDQERCQLIHQFSVLAKHLQCLIVALLDHGNDFFINGCCRFITTVQRGSSLQILALYGSQTHKTETFAHTVAGDHVAGNGCSLLNIIGCTGGHSVEYYFLSGTSTHQTY